ncbi:MAG: hypothetical protein INR72_20555 [Williamsia herbipolensis]|nr:hypothetical protein [Williamsia herbipolensis]
MSDIVIQLRDTSADAEDVAAATGELAHALDELDVEAVRPRESGDAPDGVRAGAVTEIGTLVVTALTTPGVLTALIGTVQQWLHTRSGTGTCTVTVDGDSLEIENATTAERSQLIAAWLERHRAEP